MSAYLDRIHVVQKDGGKSKAVYIPLGLSEKEKQDLLYSEYLIQGYTECEINYLLKSQKARLRANANNVSGYIGVTPFVNGRYSYGYTASFSENGVFKKGEYYRCDVDDEDSIEKAYLLACKESDRLRAWGLRKEEEYLEKYTPYNFRTELIRYEKSKTSRRRIDNPHNHQNFSISQSRQEKMLVTVSNRNNRIVYSLTAKKANGKKICRTITPDLLWFDENLAFSLQTMFEPVILELESHCTFRMENIISWEEVKNNILKFVDSNKENKLVAKRFNDKLIIRCSDKIRLYIQENKFAELDYKSKSKYKLETEYRKVLSAFLEENLVNTMKSIDRKKIAKSSIRNRSKHISYNLPAELFGIELLHGIVATKVNEEESHIVKKQQLIKLKDTERNKLRAEEKKRRKLEAKLSFKKEKVLLAKDILSKTVFTFVYTPTRVKVIVEYNSKTYYMTAKKSRPVITISIAKLKYKEEFKMPSRNGFEKLFKRVFCIAIKE